MGIPPVQLTQDRREAFRATATAVAESRNDVGWPCESQTTQRGKVAPSAPEGVDLRGQTPNRLTLGKSGLAGGLVSDDISALPRRASVRAHLSGPADGMPRKGPAGDRYTWFTCGGRDVKVTERAVRRAIRKLAPRPDRKWAVLIDGQEFRPKQTLARATALDRNRFSTLTACRVLNELGFHIVYKGWSD